MNRREIDLFPFSPSSLDASSQSELSALAYQLMESFQHNSVVISNDYKKVGMLHIQSFQPRESKSLIDEIDRILARHYGLTHEELDFIINYDFKYRMGADATAPDEGD